MKKSREEVEQEIRVKAEKLIAETLANLDQIGKPTLTDIEGEILKMRQALSEEMARLIIQAQEDVHPEGGVVCHQCGQRMQDKGEKEKTVDSLIGQVHLERSYYYCPTCREGLFPPR